MRRLVLGLAANALGIWLTTLIVTGVRVDSYGDDAVSTVITYLLVAIIFGVVNAILGTVLRVLAFPLYVLTLGLFSFIVNGIVLLAAAGVSGWFGFGLTVDGFWWGVLGALVLAVVNWLIAILFRPVLGGDRD
jgi:putative membrane protein